MAAPAKFLQKREKDCAAKRSVVDLRMRSDETGVNTMKKVTSGGDSSKATKPSAGSSPEKGTRTKPLPPLEDLGDLPRSYGTDSIFLVAQEPHWLFTYWDIDIALHPGGKTFLKVFCGEKEESEIEVPFETRNWYIPVTNAGEEYTVEIGYHRGSQWHPIARSVTIRTPQDKVSGSDRFDYATIPLHLSFQKLMENVQTTIREGESLIQALGRAQREGGPVFDGGDGIAPDVRSILEALLGSELLEELAASSRSSEELNSRIRLHLEERLHSEGASELLAKIPWRPSESSLFSALSALSGASSWTSAALSSWVAAALTSWSLSQSSSSAEFSGSLQSSWGAAVLSSWLQAAKSSGGETSWNAAALSSWLQAATSSWAGAALSSWSQAALSSWSHAETSSWGGSETLGSFGLAQRGFFMHVNAEVIFYGGTDPRATVTIDGKPVALAPDGTFRYHFVFPDGNYEIPIVATSPDGVETRSATLRFERQTGRVGEVGNTAQPPLGVPMGATV